MSAMASAQVCDKLGVDFRMLRRLRGAVDAAEEEAGQLAA